MKLDGFTKVCLNLALILLIVLLVKNLITVPEEMYAQTVRPPIVKTNVYKVSSIEEEFDALVKDVGGRRLGTDWWDKLTPNEKWTEMFNWNASKSWRFHSFIAFEGELVLIFQR